MAISFVFDRCGNDGVPAGFDRGHIEIADSGGVVFTSKNRKPDQSMMIYLSVVALLDGLRPMLCGQKRDFEFIGTDCSFTVRFNMAKDGSVSLSSGQSKIACVSPGELREAVVGGVEGFLQSSGHIPPTDSVYDDLAHAIRDFKAVK